MVARPGAILIATVSVGAGHIRAAEAIREAILAEDPSRDVDLVDVLNFGPAWARRIYRDAFLRVAAISRRAAYGLYVGTDGEKPDDRGQLERIVYRRFREFVEQGGWENVICTHFLPCQVIDADRRPPLHLVVTDYALHRYWVQPNVDSFFVATTAMAETLRTRLPRAQTFTTGIPVLSNFKSGIDADSIREELNINPDAPVALIMGGGWGLGIEDMVHRALAADVPDLVILAVCGANLRAYEAVSRIGSERLRAFAHVDDVARLMAASDLVISKPGGVTTSEALALRKPLLLTRGLPGHEDRNANELKRLGVADVADSTGLSRKIEQFFQKTELLSKRVMAAQPISSVTAAQNIAAHFHLARERVA